MSLEMPGPVTVPARDGHVPRDLASSPAAWLKALAGQPTMALDAVSIARPLLTPDRRYVVVRGRLWRALNPALSEPERAQLTAALMAARRQVAVARRMGSAAELAVARAAVDTAKRALGERGPVWWTDGAPDYNRRLAKNSPYASWYAASRIETHRLNAG